MKKSKKHLKKREKIQKVYKNIENREKRTLLDKKVLLKFLKKLIIIIINMI